MMKMMVVPWLLKLSAMGGSALGGKTHNLKAHCAGQASLSFTLLIGGIIILVGLAMASLAVSFLNATYAFQFAQRANALAASGVYDALMQLARNKDTSEAGGYDIVLGSDSATVTIVQDSPAAGQVAITSSAIVRSRFRRTIRAVASRDASTGLVSLISWQQTL